jgi:xylulokinase
VTREFDTLDLQSIYDAVLSGICELVKEGDSAKDIAVIGIDAQMGGVLGIDERWQPAIQFDPPINPNFKGIMNEVLQSYGDAILDETGSLPINGSKIRYWLRNNRASSKGVKKFLSLGAYIAGRLSGLSTEHAFIDRTTTYLFGLAAPSGWSEKLCEQLQVPLSVLPRIVESNAIVGTLRREVTESCGMRAQVPVIAGVGDTSSSILGSGVIEEGHAVDIAGTCSVFGICSSEEIIDRQNGMLLRMQAPLPDLYYLVGIGFGGEVHGWYMENIYSFSGPPRSYDELKRTAASIEPGSEDLFFFPFLGGIFTPPNDRVRGTWLGIDWNHTAAHLYRSILESFGYEYRAYDSVYREISSTPGCRSVIVTGSGRHNRLWNQIKSDILGAEYVTLNRDDQANVGTAIVAGTAVGLIDDMKDAASSCSEIQERITPNPEHTDKYSMLGDSYLRYKSVIMDSLYRGED